MSQQDYLGLGIFAAQNAVRPEQRLAELISTRLGVNVGSYELRRFVIDHWSKVSALAHQIHDEADRYAYLAAGDG